VTRISFPEAKFLLVSAENQDSYPVALYVFWGEINLDTRVDQGVRGVMGRVKGKIVILLNG